MSAAPMRLLLGPQRPESNLSLLAKRALLPPGPVAVISAGWQEAENDIDDVHELVGQPLQDLRLYERAEELFAAHGELWDAYRERQEVLKEQQRLYGLRLRSLMTAARQMLRNPGDPAILASEQRHAIAQLRALDRHHLRRIQAIHGEFTRVYNPDSYAPIAKHRQQISEVLAGCQGLLITGGNVIVLLNRMLLFGIAPMIRQRPVIAWSAGAMVLMDQIVLFHDRLPEGRRDAELLGPGLGIVPGYVILPDARHRLRKQDPVRLSLLCRRFSPSTCVTLDSGSLLQFAASKVVAAEAAGRIKSTGAIARMKVQ